MKSAVLALRDLLVADVGLEGVFLILATVLLGIGSSYLSPAGPWFVVGGICLLLAIALSIPPRRSS